MNKKHQNTKAFTLAEVLITLLIIGVIASIIIPSLLQDTQDAELKASWKKAYASLDQATKMILLDNGGSLKGLCNSGDDNCLRNLYGNYLSHQKECPNGANAGICWHSANNWKTMDGTPLTWGIGAGMILNNGSFFMLSNINKNCSTTYGIHYVCGEMAIDTNGFKSPNTLGKDIFYVHIMDNQIKPFGTAGDGEETSCRSNGIGLACAAKYLYQ